MNKRVLDVLKTSSGTCTLNVTYWTGRRLEKKKVSIIVVGYGSRDVLFREKDTMSTFVVSLKDIVSLEPE